MRRLARILLNAVTMPSLLLCLASAGLWVRSYWREDLFRWNRPVRQGARTAYAGLLSGSGGVAIHAGSAAPGYMLDWMEEGSHWHVYGRTPTRYAGGVMVNRWGFSRRSYDRVETRWTRIVFPAWLPTVLFAALPASRFVLMMRRRRRDREGHCKNCGYDLRATPDRCPECGEVPRSAP